MASLGITGNDWYACRRYKPSEDASCEASSERIASVFGTKDQQWKQVFIGGSPQFDRDFRE